MEAIKKQAQKNIGALKMLKLHIGMGLENENVEDRSLDIQIRMAEIDVEVKKMLQAISSEDTDTFDETEMTELMHEKQCLQQQLEQIANSNQKRENARSRLDKIFTILDGLKNHPMEYDDQLIRQMLECVVVESKERIKVVFVGGLEVEQELQ